MTKVEIAGAGCAVPEKLLHNEDLSQFVDTDHEWIFSRTGIEARRIAEEETTSDLCARAALNILQETGTDPYDIDLIITATMTPDYLSPSTACLVQKKIGAVNAFCFDLSAACSGFIYALSTGEKFLRSGRYGNALVLAGETMSRVIDWQDRSTCVLFGDGAGGVLLKASQRESFLAEDLHSDGERGFALTAGALRKNGQDVDAVEDLQSWYLKMDGRKIFDFALRSVPVSISHLLGNAGVHLDQIRYIIPHQANDRICRGIAKKLKIAEDRVFSNIRYYGNTSAASIPIALTEMISQNRISPGSGDLLVLTGFGGGLTWGSLLIQI